MTAALLARLTDSEPQSIAAPIAMRRICSWCVEFDPTDPANAGATHTMCPPCQQRMHTSMQTLYTFRHVA